MLLVAGSRPVDAPEAQAPLEGLPRPIGRLLEDDPTEKAAAAARVLGVKNVVFLGYDDCELVPSLDLRRRLVREIRKYRPEVVICGDPQAYFFDDRYINHPDHRAAAVAALPERNQRFLGPDGFGAVDLASENAAVLILMLAMMALAPTPFMLILQRSHAEAETTKLVVAFISASAHDKRSNGCPNPNGHIGRM